MEQEDPRGSLVALAQWYAKLGIPVFPCTGKKRPLTERGVYDATTDPGAINAWRGLNGFHLLGRPTGNGLLVVDLDNKAGKQGIYEWRVLEEAYGETPTLTAHTASGGRHLYYRTPDGYVGKSMSGQLVLPNGQRATGVDTRADGGYVIVPGSPGYSWEDVGSVEELLEHLDALPEAPAWLLGQVAKEEPGKADKADKARHEHATSSRMADLVSAILAGDNLHDSTRDMIAKLAHFTANDSYVLEVVRGVMMHSRARSVRPGEWQDRFHDLPRLLAGARAQWGHPEEEASPDDLWAAPLAIGDLLAVEPPAYRWLVEDRIQLGRGVIVTGLGGSSKTRFLYHLAVGVATGELPWDWRIGTTGKAVLVMTEDTADDVHRVLAHTCAGLDDKKRAAVAENLVIYALAGTDVKLLQRVGGICLPSAQAEALEARIKALGDVVLIGIDPALGITEGDEMDQAHQRALGQYTDNLAVRTGASAVLLTHAAKAMTTAEDIVSHSSRGAGALTDAVRGEFVLRTMTRAEAGRAGITDEEEQKRLVQVLATKGNHLPPAAYVPIWLRRGDHGVLAQTQVSLNPEVAPEELPPADRRAYEALVEMCRTHVPRIGEWRDRLEALEIIDPGQAENTRKVQMNRIKGRLVGAGLIISGMGRGTWMPAPDRESEGEK